MGFFAPQGGGYVTDNLLWYVDANEVASYPGSGATLFDLVGSNDATISGATFTTSAGLSYFNFTNTNDYISSSITDIYSSDFTIQGWVYNSATTTTNWNGAWFGQRNNSNGLELVVANEVGGARSPSSALWIGATAFGGGTNTEKYSVGTYSRQQWVFLTYRYQTGATNGSINFSFNTTIDVSYQTGGTKWQTIVAPARQYLGWWALNNSENLGFLDGRIGNCLIYNRLLTDQEILDNYDVQKALYGY